MKSITSVSPLRFFRLVITNGLSKPWALVRMRVVSACADRGSHPGEVKGDVHREQGETAGRELVWLVLELLALLSDNGALNF
jgi:hypothetical protein